MFHLHDRKSIATICNLIIIIISLQSHLVNFPVSLCQTSQVFSRCSHFRYLTGCCLDCYFRFVKFISVIDLYEFIVKLNVKLKADPNASRQFGSPTGRRFSKEQSKRKNKQFNMTILRSREVAACVVLKISRRI